MSVNFDAKLSLDISQFLSGVKRAEGALRGLEAQIKRVNSQALTPRVQANTAVAGGIGVNSIAQRQAETAIIERATKAHLTNQAAMQSGMRGLARERYALYDVAAAYTLVAAASAGAVTALVKTAADYERAFANVVRTTEFTSIKVGEAARVMRFELMQLANEIPVTFGQITQIATIGNQLGIAQADLVNFTETVSKFAATTDVTIENAAMSFGRIGELLNVEDFNALGSAIAFAGVNAVATETQILAITKEIATTAKQAKFAAPDVVGLATALGSLGIAPEAARGSIIRSFAAINKAISEGGSSLQAYANIAGMTSEQFAGVWQTNGAQAFDALLKGLQAASDSGQNLDSVLRGLGIKNVRDIQTLQKLGDNYGVYAQSIQDANKAFEEGVFLSEAYGVIQETVAAKIQVVQNKVSNLIAGLGESTSGPVSLALDVLNGLLDRLQEFSRNPAGQVATGIIGVFLALAAAIAAVNAIAALGTATLYAYATAMGTAKIAADGTVIGLNRMATAAKIANVALKSIGIGLVIGAAVTAISVLGDEIQRAGDEAGYLRRKGEEILGGFGGLQEALTKDLEAYQSVLRETGNSEAAKAQAGIWYEVSDAVVETEEGANNSSQAISQLASLFGITTSAASGTNGELQTMNVLLGENTAQWIKNALFQSESFRSLLSNQQAMDALTQSGFNMDQALQAAANGTLTEYMNGVEASAVQAASGFEKWTYEMHNSGNAIGYLLAFIPRLLNEIATFFGVPLFAVTNATDQIEKGIGGATNQALLLGSASNNASKNMEEYNKQVQQAEKNTRGAARELRTVVDYANDLRGAFSRVTDIRFGSSSAQDDIADGWDNIAEKAEDAQEAINKANAEIKELTADKSVIEYQLAVANRYGDEKRAAVLRARLAKIDDKLTDAQENLTDAQAAANKTLVGNTKAARENRDALEGMVGKYQDYILALVRSGLKGEELEKKILELKEAFKQQAKEIGFAEEELDPYLGTLQDFKDVAEKMPRRVDIEFNSNISAADQALKEYLAKLKQTSGTFTSKIDVVLPDPGTLKPIVDSWTLRAMGNALMWGGITMSQYYKGAYGIDLKKYAAGGFVSGPGSSRSDSIPAMLSNGEFVMRAKAVRAYGLDFMNAINGMKPIGSMGGFSGGAMGAGGVTIAQLSPEDRALLRAAVERPINLYADSKKIAQTANDGNNLIARRGVR